MKKTLIALLILFLICLFVTFVSAIICGTEVISEVLKLIIGYGSSYISSI